MKYLIYLQIAFFVLNQLNGQNQAATGFDLDNSDPKAIAIADDVMNAMGGRKAWDKTRYLTWNFFGSRVHIWDKKTGDVRIEGLKDKSVAIINIYSEKGIIYRNQETMSNPDSLAKYIKQAKSQWINDSYWLVMPFKLKDSGVTLKYLGEGMTQKGEQANILSLTFNAVGNTPQNKYHVWVSQRDKLVKQWAFYQLATNETPGFTLPWDNYQKMDRILLATDRGERKLTEVKVLKKIDPKLMKDPRPEKR